MKVIAKDGEEFIQLNPLETLKVMLFLWMVPKMYKMLRSEQSRLLKQIEQDIEDWSNNAKS